MINFNESYRMLDHFIRARTHLNFCRENIQSESHSSRSEKVRLKVTMQNPQHLISDEGMKSSRPDSSLSAQLPYSNVEKKSTDKH